MNLIDVIRLEYPVADLRNDIQLQDDGQGIYISYWNTELLGKQPTEQELLDKIPELQAQHDLNTVLNNRKNEYPNTDELIIALWEKVVEGRSEVANELQAKRQAVKTTYPKD